MNQPQHERQRIEFGDEVRTLRKSMKITGVALAAETGISQSKLSKIETGALIPSTQDLFQILTVLDAPRKDMQRLVKKAQALRTEYASWRFEHRNGLGAKQIRVAELERQSHAIRSFRLEAVPGLLQTHEYARQAMSLANFTGQTDLDHAVSARMRRQEVLYDTNRQFDFLIAEMGVLSRFCAPSVAIRQLDRLKMLAALPNVTIGFIPNRVHLPQPPVNSFVLYDSALATFESLGGEGWTSEEQGIATYRRVFKDFATVALYGEDADAFLDECTRYLLEIESAPRPTGRRIKYELSLASTSER